MEEKMVYEVKGTNSRGDAETPSPENPAEHSPFPIFTPRSREMARNLGINEEEVLDYGDGLHLSLDGLMQIAEREGIAGMEAGMFPAQPAGQATFWVKVTRQDGASFQAFGHADARDLAAREDHPPGFFLEDLAEKRARAKALRLAYLPTLGAKPNLPISEAQRTAFYTLCGEVAKKILSTKEAVAQRYKDHFRVASANDFTQEQFQKIHDSLCHTLAVAEGILPEP